ncbi:MAG: AraC family transcriptional regulator [Eubacteriaceae bacterium]|jgi:AraC-like DNA-binding protein
MNTPLKTVVTDNAKQETTNKLDPAFPFRVEYEKLSYYCCNTFGIHWHSDLEFTIIKHGKMKYQANDKVVLLEEGNGMFINTNTLHSGTQTEKGQDCENYVVRVEPSLIGGAGISDIYRKYISRILNDKHLCFLYLSKKIGWQKEILDILDDLADIYREQEDGFELDMMSRVFKICWLFEKNLNHEVDDAETVRLCRDTEKLKQALTYIDEHYQERITLENIAASCWSGKTECCRIFKNIVHQSPVDYVNSRRIQASMSLLTDPALSVTEIAQSVGFSGSSYYSEVFKKENGMTPSSYRKSLSS